MKNHKFVFCDKDNDGKNTYYVNCLATGGMFNSNIWVTGKVQNQICPCCGRIIIKDKRKGNK